MKLPIWHQDTEGKWYLIPNTVRDNLTPNSILIYYPCADYWSIYEFGDDTIEYWSRVK